MTSFGKQIKFYNDSNTLQFQYINTDHISTIRVEFSPKIGSEYKHGEKASFQFRSYELFSFVELLLNFNEHFKTTTSHDNKMLYINRNSSGAINFNYAENKTKFSHNIPPERCKELALFVCAQAANAAGMSVTDMMNVLKVTR